MASGGRRVDFEQSVIQLSLDGEPLHKYPSVRAAARAVGCSPSNIIKVCKGIRKTASNYIWKYVN